MNFDSIIPVFIFILYLYGVGKLFSPHNALIETFAFGIASLPVISVIFNSLRIPLDWRIFFGLAMIAPAYQVIQWLKRGGKITRPVLKRPFWPSVLMIVIFIFAVGVYCWGPFQYPWLENDDSWSHAASIKYVAVEKNLNAPDGLFQYLNPYPPAYAIIIGLLHQVSPSLYWTLKFFNGFIICLGFLFFYAFMAELTKNKGKAALAAFFLALIPCYLTHFIWSHALVVTLFFPAFLFLLKSFHEKKYIIPAAVCCAAIVLTQPTQAIKFAVMAAMLIAAFIPQKIQWKNIGLVILISGILSLVWWGPIIVNTWHGRSQIVLRDETKIAGSTQNTGDVAQAIFSPTGGTATRAYTWDDYAFIAKPNLINNPTGLGPMILLLTFLGIIFLIMNLLKRQDVPYLLTILLWLIFTFLGMNSMTFNLPIGLFAFRFWMLFAIPISCLCAEAIYSINDVLQFKWNKILVVSLFIIAVIRVNLPFKWNFNTGEWHYGVHWAADEDIEGYVWMRENIPPETRVFAFTDNILVLGHDMRADFWRDDYQQTFGSAFHQDLDSLASGLKKHHFELLIISPRDIWEFGVEEVNAKLKSLLNDKRFRIIFNNEAVKIFQIL